MQVTRLALQLILGIGLTYALQRWDRRRLDDEQRARTWNVATWGAALYVFGWFSMVAWGFVTRGKPGWRGFGRGVVGALLGLAAGLCIAFTMRALDLAFAWTFNLPLDLDTEIFGD